MKKFVAEGWAFNVRVVLKYNEKEELVRYLASDLNVFTWSPNDILEISPMTSQHRLDVLLGTKLVK